jgi:hypothetical protein
MGVVSTNEPETHMKQLAATLILAAATIMGCGAPAESDDDDKDEESLPELVDLGNATFEIYVQTDETAFWEETQKFHTEVVLCVNNGGDYGNYVAVENLGTVPIEGSIVVSVGIMNEADGSLSFAPKRLSLQARVEPGDAARLAGPYCSGVEAVYRAGERTRVFVLVDPDDVIEEADEENSFGYAADPLAL